MAVHVLPGSRASVDEQAASLPAAVLALVLLPAALDLLQVVQPALIQVLRTPSAIAGGAAAAILLVTWLRYPRTSWLLAASLAALASLGLRLMGAELAPLLSLLSIVSLGIGGAFATTTFSPADA